MAKRKLIKFEVDNKGCFNCISHVDRGNGYPTIYADGKQQNMHRFIYKQMFGEIPQGLVVRHKCDNRSCINPEHLELGTIADNNRDIWERGRENVTARKFNKEEIKDILLRIGNGELQTSIARSYGVSLSTINHIKTGRNYRRLTS